MLTLGELKKMVAETEPAVRVPTSKSLRESKIPVAARKEVSVDADVSVYQNGFVLYQADGHVTVFPLHSCGEYYYTSPTGEECHISSDYFDREVWYVRLLLEGEDRIALNGEKNLKARSISYSAAGDGWIPGAQASSNPLDRILEQDRIQELLDMMTESQQRVVIRCFIDLDPQNEVAVELGVSPQAVSDLIVKGVCRVRRQYGITDRRLKKGKAKQSK